MTMTVLQMNQPAFTPIMLEAVSAVITKLLAASLISWAAQLMVSCILLEQMTAISLA